VFVGLADLRPEREVPGTVAQSWLLKKEKGMDIARQIKLASLKVEIVPIVRAAALMTN